jgi:hypothetical protein
LAVLVVRSESLHLEPLGLVSRRCQAQEAHSGRPAVWAKARPLASHRRQVRRLDLDRQTL